jgi:hypothetical protein
MMVVMQIASIALVVADVLVARSLLSELLHATQADHDVRSLLPQVLGLAGLTAALGVANAVQLHYQRILAELCTRLGEDRVLAVTASVPLSAFDAPGFHDALERAVLAVCRLPAVILSLSGLLRATAGAHGRGAGARGDRAGVCAGSAAGADTDVDRCPPRARLLPIRLCHHPSDCERRYLTEILADGDAAKEVRAHGLPKFFDDRRDRLWTPA